MKKVKSIFFNLIFNQQLISYLLEILNSIVLSSNKFGNFQKIESLEKKILPLEKKIISLEEKIKTYNEEIQSLKEYQKEILKMVRFLFILSLNLFGVTLLIFIFLLKFHLK